MQIIALSLPAGVIVFAMIAVFVVGALNQPPTGMLISLFAVGFAFVAFVMHLVMPQLIARRSSLLQMTVREAQRPYMVYQAQMIVKLALLEGAAFFNVICLMVEHNWWSLGIAGLLVGSMLTQFPTRERVERWIAQQGIANRE